MLRPKKWYSASMSWCRVWAGLTALTVLLAVACGDDDSTDRASAGGTGGAGGSGGTATGGSGGTGGQTGGSGGATGGASGSGGAAGVGGTGGSGASAGAGGAAGSSGAGGSGGTATSDLAIDAGRFTRNGQPFFPVGNFLTSENSSGPRTHTYLSEQVSDGDRQHMISVAVNAGYNVFSIYTYNEGDYGGIAISPFEGGGFGGSFDTAKLATWETRIEAIVSAGLHPIIWLVPDDSSNIHTAGIPELQDYIAEMVDRFDDMPVLWILALEADEYWNASRVQTLGEYLASQTTRPVGLHQLGGQSSMMQAGWVDFGAYQYGFGKSWQEIFDDTVSTSAALGKPMIGMEYDLDDGDNDDRLGLAVAFGGAVGVGNGAPSGLASFMAGLPAGMTSSRTGTHATLDGGGVTAVADMAAMTFATQ